VLRDHKEGNKLRDGEGLISSLVLGDEGEKMEGGVRKVKSVFKVARWENAKIPLVKKLLRATRGDKSSSSRLL